MSYARGGSNDGTDWSGHPQDQRKLVLVKRDAAGEAVPGEFETYIREAPAGDWNFAHLGATSEADGPWKFRAVAGGA